MGNTKKIQELMMNSIFEVFEKMFFVFLEPLDEEIKYDMISSIKFAGPVKGEIDVFFSRGMAQSMVENMLALKEKEWEISQKLIERAEQRMAALA